MTKQYKTLIVFIGEGKTEYAFIASLLKNKYGYTDNYKNTAFLEKGNKLFCLAHPRMGACHKGGDCTIYAEETYKKIKGLLLTTNNFVFNKGINIKYLILTDIKLSQKKIEGAEKSIKKHLSNYAGEIFMPFASLEIETWFLAGIGKEFQDSYEIDSKKLKIFLGSKNIDTKRNTKEILDGILPESISGKTVYIGEEFGRYIDVDLGIKQSVSFKNFITEFKKIV